MGEQIDVRVVYGEFYENRAGLAINPAEFFKLAQV
jgi:hypothetical protein